MRKMYCLAKKNFEAYSEVSPDAVRVNVLQGMCAEFIQENEYHWDFRLGNGQEFILETDDIEKYLDVPEFIPSPTEVMNAYNYWRASALAGRGMTKDERDDLIVAHAFWITETASKK